MQRHHVQTPRPQYTVIPLRIRDIRLLVILCTIGAQIPHARAPSQESTVVEDFESYGAGGIPTDWKILDEGRLRPLTPTDMSPNEYFRITVEDDNQFVRAYTKGEAIQMTLPNGEGYRWNLESDPCLSWDWRALKLPEGAREDEVNDTGGAVYVTYSVNFLGIPRSIKYTYSSSLPVGTVVSFRGLKVLVVTSGINRAGEWMRMERNAAEDYRRLWGRTPPDEPRAVTLWSDSNSTGREAMVDFDNLTIQSGCSSG